MNANSNQIYDIIFIGLIISLIVLYVVFNKTDSKDKNIEDIDIDMNIDDIIIKNKIKHTIKEQNSNQHKNDVTLFEADAYKHVDFSDLPWDENIVACESESELDSLNTFVINNLYGKKRQHIMY